MHWVIIIYLSDCTRNLTEIFMAFGLCIIKSIFNLSDEVWVLFYYIDDFTDSLILLLIVFSQRFVQFKDVLVLVIKIFELSGVLGKIDLLFNFFLLEQSCMLLSLPIKRLSYGLHLVPKPIHFFLFQLFHLFWEVQFLASYEKFFLVLPQLFFDFTEEVFFDTDFSLTGLFHCFEVLGGYFRKLAEWHDQAWAHLIEQLGRSSVL